MMEKRHHNDEAFAAEFLKNPRARDEAIDRLVSGSNRMLLNIPRYGLARRISRLLRQGSFSDFYEFEKGLARRLHPLLARLNLNLVSELLITNHFFHRYRRYAPDATRVLGGDPVLEADALEEMITAMAEREGHHMAVKFCDLVVRTVDRKLFRTLRSVELALVEMRKAAFVDGAADREHAEKIAGELRSRIGDDATAMFLRRLHASSPRINHSEEKTPSPGEIETTAPGARPSIRDVGRVATGPREHGMEGRIPAYARALRVRSLDRIGGTDRARIRRFIDAVFRKNELRFGVDEARAIILGVLRDWERDESIEEPKRHFFEELIEEWTRDENNDVIEGADSVDVDVRIATGGEPAPAETLVEPSGDEAREEPRDGPFLIDEAGEGEGIGDPEIAVDMDIDDSYLIDGDGGTDTPVEAASGAQDSPGPGPSFPQVEFDDEKLDPGVIGDVDQATGGPEGDTAFVVRDELLFEDSSLDTQGNAGEPRGRVEPGPEDPESEQDRIER